MARMLVAELSVFAQLVELTYYRWSGCRLFVHYQGDDARQGEFQLTHYEYSIAANVSADYYSARSDAFKRRSIKRMDRFCHGIYALNPDLLNVLPRRAMFSPYAHVFPCEYEPVYPQLDSERPLRIGHAPTDRAVKGTQMILEALATLKGQGYVFELVLIEGLTHHEAVQKICETDVFVDQLLAGWYGGVAVEAMALGKPVVVYIRKGDLAQVPEGMSQELPFIDADPATIEAALRTVLEMPRRDLHALGVRSRKFVEDWHDPSVVATQMLAAYDAN